MILTVPWALFGLLALPLVWWFHLKLRKPPEVELPSLMFVQDEEEARALPRGRRLDGELLLALAGLALLAFAAAGPRLVQQRPRRVVQVVVSAGAPAARPGYLEGVAATLASLRGSLGDDDETLLQWVPPPGDDGTLAGPRPSPAELLGEATAGRASLRVVISDLPAPEDAEGVVWVELGDARVSNVGIVAVSFLPEQGALYATLAAHGDRPVRGLLGAHLAGDPGDGPPPVPFEVGADDARAVLLPLGSLAGSGLVVRLRTEADTAWQDALVADDEVRLRHGAAVVYVDRRVPVAHAERVRLALAAVRGADGYRIVTRPAEATQARLGVVLRGTSPLPRSMLVLELEPLADGAPAERAPPGPTRVASDELVRDLWSEGAEWVYAAGAARAGAEETVLLGRSAGGRTWPILLARAGVLRLGPDPLRGQPRPADTAFWPLLVDNLLRRAEGPQVGGGYRAVGLLDPASSRLGRGERPLDPRVLEGVAPTEPGRDRPLRAWLILGALLCLALLWAAPRLRSALAGRARVVGDIRRTTA